MKTLLNTIIKKIGICASILLLASCSSTTITEYDDKGNVVKVTETNESPVVVLAGNTKDKHLLFHQGGFYFNVGVQPSNNSYGIGGGSVDNTYASIVASDGTKDGEKVAKQFSKIVNASKYKLSVSTEGVNSENETIPTAKKTETKGN